MLLKDQLSDSSCLIRLFSWLPASKPPRIPNASVHHVFTQTKEK